jgi:endonuclease/exonuclease/phosphatase family metal-dependent hydrolase
LDIQTALNKQHEKIRVMSYNMLFDLYDHNLEEVNRWPQRLPRIAELVEGSGPDLIGIQELQSHQAADLMQQVGETYGFFTKPSDDGEKNGILYRKSRFEIVDQQVIYMSDTPQTPCKDTLTVIKLKDTATDKVLAICNTHLAFSNIEKRAFQADFIQKFIQELEIQMPVLLTGDLNTFPNRPDMIKLPFFDGDYILKKMSSPTFCNARDVSLLGHVGPMSTFTNVVEDAAPFKGTGTPGVFLDHIFVSTGITVLIHAVQPATVNGNYPSDHMPVLVDFIIN